MIITLEDDSEEVLLQLCSEHGPQLILLASECVSTLGVGLMPGTEFLKIE